MAFIIKLSMPDRLRSRDRRGEVDSSGIEVLADSKNRNAAVAIL